MRDQSPADASNNNWVNQFLPTPFIPYARLARLDRPIGSWLLFWPCLCGVWLAQLETGLIPLSQTFYISALFAVGAIVMRGAGCTWNDITDRDFDGSVERTKSRPIPSGQVSVKQAIAWMGLQALIALAFCSRSTGLRLVWAFYRSCLCWFTLLPNGLRGGLKSSLE